MEHLPFACKAEVFMAKATKGFFGWFVQRLTCDPHTCSSGANRMLMLLYLHVESWSIYHGTGCSSPLQAIRPSWAPQVEWPGGECDHLQEEFLLLVEAGSYPQPELG